MEHFTKINALETLSHPSNTRIFIGPDNRVLILRKDYRTAEQGSTIFDQNGSYLCSWLNYFCFSDKFLKVDPKIVNLAQKILEKKEIKQRHESEKNHLTTRITKLESDLEKVIQCIKQSKESNKQQFEIVMGKLNDLSEGNIHICAAGTSSN